MVARPMERWTSPKRLLPLVKVVLEPKPGKGVAMQSGFAAAMGDIIITLDADGLERSA